MGSSNAMDQWIPSQWVKCVTNGEPMMKCETNDEPMVKWSMDIRVGLLYIVQMNSINAVFPGPKTEISRSTREYLEIDLPRSIWNYLDQIWYYLSLLWLYGPNIPLAKSKAFLIHFGKLMGHLLVPLCVYRAGQYPTKLGLEGRGSTWRPEPPAIEEYTAEYINIQQKVDLSWFTKLGIS